MFRKIEFPQWAYGDSNYCFLYARCKEWLVTKETTYIAARREQVLKVLQCGDADYSRIEQSYEAYARVAKSKDRWEYIGQTVVTNKAARNAIKFMCRWNGEREIYIEFLSATKGV